MSARLATVAGWSLWTVSLALAATGLVFLALSWTVQIPEGWGFRGFTALFAVVFATVGLTIAAHRRANAIGWVLLVAGVLSGVQVAAEEYSVFALVARPGEFAGGEIGAWLQSWIWVSSIAMVGVVVVLLFPTGHLRSDRWKPVLAAAGLAVILASFAFAVNPGRLSGAAAIVDNPFGIPALSSAVFPFAGVGFFLLAGVVIAAFGSVALRFRDARGVERRQLKWFAYAGAFLAFAVGLNAFAQLTYVGDATLIQGGQPKPWQYLLILAMCLLPVSVGVAILRYRLYDIDLLINRTAVYGATSLAIAVTFFIGIVALQAVLRPLTAGNELAIAASTLVSFALFQPIRRRVQDAVDRRFDRSRYDAARTLDVFADRLRDEVDLDALRGDLLAAVRATMAPAHTSLWLRDR
jgi:hypothetical protein